LPQVTVLQVVTIMAGKRRTAVTITDVKAV
jgi:hypothetical protein